METISSIETCTERVICNCAGLHGQELVQDTNGYALRGHFFVLNDAAGDGHMDYMLFTKISQGNSIERIYLFPKSKIYTKEHPDGIVCAGIVGGTFIPGVEALDVQESHELDAREYEKLLERTNVFFYGGACS
jgi:hypothetical protein